MTDAIAPNGLDRVEGHDALRLLGQLSPDDQATFADWCQTMSVPMDAEHLPALFETWRDWRLIAPASGK